MGTPPTGPAPPWGETAGRFSVEGYHDSAVARQEQAASLALDRAAGRLSVANAALESGVERWDQARTRLAAAERSRAAVLAALLGAHLASLLDAGHPCPACGSLNHPDPAVAPPVADASKVALSDAEAGERQARAAFEHSRRRATSARQALERARARLEKARGQRARLLLDGC